MKRGDDKLESILEMGKGQSERALWEKSSEESLSGLEEHFPVLILGVRNYNMGLGLALGLKVLGWDEA